MSFAFSLDAIPWEFTCVLLVLFRIFVAAVAAEALVTISVSIIVSFSFIVSLACSLNKLVLSSFVKTERTASRNASSLDSVTLGEWFSFQKLCFASLDSQYVPNMPMIPSEVVMAAHDLAPRCSLTASHP